MELHGNCLTYLLAKFNYKKNKLGDVMLQKLRHVRFGRTSPERSSSIRCLATRMIDMFFFTRMIDSLITRMIGNLIASLQEKKWLRYQLAASLLEAHQNEPSRPSLGHALVCSIIHSRKRLDSTISTFGDVSIQ